MEKSAKATRCTYSVAPILQLVAVIGVMVWAWSVWAGSGAPRAAAAEYVAASVKASAVAPASPPEPTAQADAPIAAAHPISARIDPAWLDVASARTGIPRPALALGPCLGPFQFIPQTWCTWGADGNGDRKADPNQIEDAALAAARYLCHAGDLSSVAGWRRAVFSYSHRDSYVDDVARVANSYRS